MSLTRREIDEIRPKVIKAVEKFLGFEEPALSETALHCVSAGYTINKTAEKLSSLLEPGKAERLAEKVVSVLDSLKVRKRHINNDVEEMTDVKRIKTEKDAENNDKKPELSVTDIKDMMANAQKLIEERKKALQTIGKPTKDIKKEIANNHVAATKQAINSAMKLPAEDKAKKIAMLQEQIKNKLAATGVFSGGDKPTPLILDSEGRTIDSSGREVQLTHVVPTLKANIRAKKREEFKAHSTEKPAEVTVDNKFYDYRISNKSNVRSKKSLRFNEPGKFVQMADRMRMKAQLQKLQSEISQIAKKTGITSATKLAQIAPKVKGSDGDIPDIEWWDSVIVENNTYGDGEDLKIKVDTITHLVEHPQQMKAPTHSAKPIVLPVYLTKKERKKLRRQNRRETWKEEQEKIRLGLIAPPEPKLRISNLMRVLGTEAVQDPTKMEAHVKAQMAKRAKAHEEANLARKLTDEQRRDKRRRKLQEDTTLGIHVSVYRVKDLSNISKKFKIEMNCKQLYMTGGVIMFKDCNVIVVEGGAKQQSKFKRLMINRIKWEEDMVKSLEGKEEPNKCSLVWEGMTKQRNFGEIKFKVCASELLAREQLRKHGVEQYWDLAYSVSVLEIEEK